MESKETSCLRCNRPSVDIGLCMDCGSLREHGLFMVRGDDYRAMRNNAKQLHDAITGRSPDRAICERLAESTLDRLARARGATITGSTGRSITDRREISTLLCGECSRIRATGQGCTGGCDKGPTAVMFAAPAHCHSRIYQALRNIMLLENPMQAGIDVESLRDVLSKMFKIGIHKRNGDSPDPLLLKVGRD